MQFPGVCLHDVPDDLLRHPVAPNCSRTTDTSEQFPVVNLSCREPFIEEPFHPVGNWNSSNVTAFSNQIHDGPMILATLKVVESQVSQLSPSKPTAQQDSNNCTVALTFERFSIG